MRIGAHKRVQPFIPRKAWKEVCSVSKQLVKVYKAEANLAKNKPKFLASGASLSEPFKLKLLIISQGVSTAESSTALKSRLR